MTIGASAVLLTWLLVIRQPDFHVRYTIFVSAPLTLLAAGGVAGLDPGWWRGASGHTSEAERSARTIGHALPWIALAGLVTANGVALYRLYHDTAVHKPDFRSAAAHIQANLQPGDIVLVDGPNPELVFAHYYDGDAPVHDLRALEGLPDGEVDEAMRDITAGAGRAWELLYFKPPGPGASMAGHAGLGRDADGPQQHSRSARGPCAGERPPTGAWHPFRRCARTRRLGI